MPDVCIVQAIPTMEAPILLADLSWECVAVSNYTVRWLEIRGYTVKKLLSELQRMFEMSNESNFKCCTRNVGERPRFQVEILSYKDDGVQGHLIIPISLTGLITIKELIDAIPEPICITDSGSKMIYMNNRFTEAVGFQRELIEGYKVAEIQAHGIWVKNPVSEEVIRQKKPIARCAQYSSGQIVQLHGVPVLDSDDEVAYVVVTGRDLTELYVARKQLNELVTEYARSKSEFEGLNRLYDLSELVYASDNMKVLMEKCNKISQIDANVFLHGETGVGKEMLARRIHKYSSRGNKPFIAINCASIPETLFESELFGYEDGAFTGAKRGGKPGIFEVAEGGTLFLDEIGEMPYAMQSKLLRVLQEKQFTRVGGVKPHVLDVRIISATNLTNDQIRDASLFRQDLYYRLAVFPIYIPPLRKRTEDIDVLIDYFLSCYNQQFGEKICMTNVARRCFHNYSWPGNVRELRNAIERYVILGSENASEQSEKDIWGILSGIDDPIPDAQSNDARMSLSQYLDSKENEYLSKVVSSSASLQEAAEMLSISVPTLYRKIKKYGLSLRNI